MEINNVVLLEKKERLNDEMGLQCDLINNPSHYTVWFRQAFPALLSKINK